MSVCHYRIDSLTQPFRHECISTQSEELKEMAVPIAVAFGAALRSKRLLRGLAGEEKYDKPKEIFGAL